MATGSVGGKGLRYEHDQTHWLEKHITYTSLDVSNTITVGILPAYAIVLRGATKIITAFDDTNGDDLDVGISGSDDDLFASMVDLNSTATTAFDDLAADNDYSTTERIVTCNLTTNSSSDGTTGSAVVYLEYIILRSVA